MCSRDKYGIPVGSFAGWIKYNGLSNFLKKNGVLKFILMLGHLDGSVS